MLIVGLMLTKTFGSTVSKVSLEDLATESAGDELGAEAEAEHRLARAVERTDERLALRRHLRRQRLVLS